MQNNNSLADDATPLEFYLSQNYPNPFKEKTTIKYCVAYKTKVKLTVFNHYGEVIENLVDEEKRPGTYEVHFSVAECNSGKRANFSQGYYYYQMTAGDYTSEKKWLCINKLSRSITMKSLLQTLLFLLLITQFCFAQWIQVGLDDKSIKDIATKFNFIFAISSDSGSVYRSSDNGVNWLKIVDSKATDIAVSLPPIAGEIFMVRDSLSNGNLSVSSDFGDTWQRLNVVEQLPSQDYPVLRRVFTTPGGFVLCGMDVFFGLGESYNAFALSTDMGLTWTTPGWDIYGGRLFDYNNNFWITSGDWNGNGGHSADVHLSSDYGLTWNRIGYPVLGTTTLNLCSNGNILQGAQGIEGGLWLSIDSCNTWTRVSTITPQTGLSIEPGGTLVGTDSLGVFFFSDNGDSLGSCNDGLTNLNIHTLTIDDNNYVYAGTNNGVWRRPLSEIVTSVEEHQIEIPLSIILSQNFPNPFNPSTKIKYSVPQTSRVQIKVFDVLGNEIETLVNQEKPAGTYELTWNAASAAGGLPSGVYFYQLKAGDYINTKKMILLK